MSWLWTFGKCEGKAEDQLVNSETRKFVEAGVKRLENILRELQGEKEVA